ncbi:MAG TPA: FCD domain-containing protein [Halothiobacillus sp.]|nr:FCD domain-containing protein [Halothiobacillus sp.]
MMEARLIFEPGITDLTVRDANSADFTVLEQCCCNADEVEGVEQFEYWDDAFHRALAAATHNGLLINVLTLMLKGRDQSEWGLLKDKAQHWNVGPHTSANNGQY